ncbi:hypothetical protein PLICRDRAFT_151289 [Plicaturopsis crispa FD-325 SS-3]|nr:hypothetical protein PLICRDRAFT_151289 [Plicaturopsis crispa FD-325 SS-3]
MSRREPQSGVDPPNKRPRLSKNEKGGYRFTNANEIRLSLRNADGLNETLTALRNQFTVKYNETSIAPQDERLLLAQNWLDAVPGAQDIFEIWESVNQQRQQPLIALAVSLLSCLLTLLSTHYSHHSYGHPIIRTLLSPAWMRRLTSYLGGSHTELTLVTLKLLNSLSAFASGRERKNILEAFPWEIKSLPKLLNMRRRSKTEEYADTLVRPDIRTLYVLFILSFVEPETTSSVKAAFLEQHRDIFLSMFKGLRQDAYGVVRKVLEICWAGIWSDAKVKRTIKIGLFNEMTLSQIIKLYERTAPEDQDPDHVTADLIHHFLLAICTRPGIGVCFRDRGWFPREFDEDRTAADDSSHTAHKGGKIYNKILSNILKGLKVNEDSRQQELALKIMTACPELVAGYWPAAALTLEPRLSSKWIANISFFGTIISLPVPSSTFLLPNSDLYQPTPPPLSSTLENILPAVHTKIHFSKGLQSASPLVQHCTALALAKCLTKYGEVVRAFRHIANALEEDEIDGQWLRRLGEVEREVRKRIPDFQVVVAFSQQKSTEVPAPGVLSNATRTLLLSECAQRLLWLYHRYLPLLVGEARFDVGKLLTNLLDASTGAESEDGNEEEESDEEDGQESDVDMEREEEDGASPDVDEMRVDGSDDASEESDGSDDGADEEQPIDPTFNLQTVRQLHILRLLKESDQFSWSSKMASSSHSYLYVLLKAYNVAENSAIRSALTSLLRHVLSESILFQDDPDEVQIWLDSILTIPRVPGTESPDGAPLTDEGDSVVVFLDDCVQRCIKTPYRYLEDIQSLARTDASDTDSNTVRERRNVYPSPLLMTVVEQLNAKAASKLLTPSDVLALASFVRRLVFRLSTKQDGLQFVDAVAKKIDSSLHVDKLFPEHPTVTNAIRREVFILYACLQYPPKSAPSRPSHSDSAVDDFLAAVEQMPIPDEAAARKKCAFELVDWLRLLEYPLRPQDLTRLTALIARFYEPALSAVIENLDPAQDLLWQGLDIISQLPELIDKLQFEWLFINSSDAELADSSCQTALVQLVDTELVGAKRAFCVIAHGIESSKDQPLLQRELLLLSAAIMDQLKTTVTPLEFEALKTFIFTQSQAIQDICILQHSLLPLHQGLAKFIAASLDPSSTLDQNLVADITAHWSTVLKSAIQSGKHDETIPAVLWISYMEQSDLYDLFDFVCDNGGDTVDSPFLDVLGAILDAAAKSLHKADIATAPESALRSRLTRLLALRRVLPNSLVLENLIATALDAHLPAYPDGQSLLVNNLEPLQLYKISLRSEDRWSRQSHSTPEHLTIRAFLDQSSWSDSTARIISSMLYRQHFPADIFLEWLGTNECFALTTRHLATTLLAFFDSNESLGDLRSEDCQCMNAHISRLVATIADSPSPRDLRVVCKDCVLSISQAIPSFRGQVAAHVKSAIDALPVETITLELVSLGRRLHTTIPLGIEVILVLNQGLQWAVRYLSGAHEDVEKQSVLEELTSLVKTSPDAAVHLVDPVLTAVVQNRLSDAVALNLMIALVQKTALKGSLLTSSFNSSHRDPLIQPANVNRYIQAILQHPHFFKFARSTSPARDALVGVLYALFITHPTNTCQPTHVEPLVRVYQGTLSSADRQLLSIFQLFEDQRKTSVASLLCRWSTTSDTPSLNALEALQSLDAVRVLRSSLAFPNRRHLTDDTVKSQSLEDENLYDPVFVILLFWRVITDGPPDSAVGWVQLFRTNVVGLLIRALSSKDVLIRDLALSQLSAMWKCLEFVDMQEKPHVVYIMNVLKDLIPPPSEEPTRRLPTYTTLILLHALRGVFYPSNFIYPLTARFLLQRPELDITDVPMLYGMLYSSTDDWKKERGWILRFLADGMTSTDEWRIFKRRHTWDLLSSLFQSSEKDRILRNGVLEARLVLANLTCNIQATTSLILKSSLLTWIEMQLQTVKNNEGIAWVRILENIVVIVDPGKMESSIQGAWRSSLCRCLSLLLDDETSSSSTAIFALAVPVILRLSLLPGPLVPDLPILVSRGVAHLKQLEKNITLAPGWQKTASQPTVSPLPPYGAREIHASVPTEDLLHIWGTSVEALWRVNMAFDTKLPTWNTLSCRMLMWRAMTGVEGSQTGEWTRTNVVRNLRS